MKISKTSNQDLISQGVDYELKKGEQVISLHTKREIEKYLCDIPINSIEKNNIYNIDTCKKCKYICNSVIAILHANK